jgi:hypothetical protein
MQRAVYPGRRGRANARFEIPLVAAIASSMLIFVSFASLVVFTLHYVHRSDGAGVAGQLWRRARVSVWNVRGKREHTLKMHPQQISEEQSSRVSSEFVDETEPFRGSWVCSFSAADAPKWCTGNSGPAL